MNVSVIVSCEHGGHRVPAKYAHLFCGHQATLTSHRGWDPGSLGLGRRFARRFQAPLVATTVTRLLVEINRSPRHPALFSEFSAKLAESERERLLARYYLPHRQQVETLLRTAMAAGRLPLHLSMHSFTPILHGQERQADIGLLYDPRRPLEQKFCTAVQNHLRQGALPLRIRRNYPYRGAADGLTTSLRRLLPADRYLGIELEVNQRWVNQPQWLPLQRQLLDAVAAGVADLKSACR